MVWDYERTWNKSLQYQEESKPKKNIIKQLTPVYKKKEERNNFPSIDTQCPIQLEIGERIDPFYLKCRFRSICDCWPNNNYQYDMGLVFLSHNILLFY